MQRVVEEYCVGCRYIYIAHIGTLKSNITLFSKERVVCNLNLVVVVVYAHNLSLCGEQAEHEGHLTISAAHVGNGSLARNKFIPHIIVAVKSALNSHIPL